MSQRCWKQFCGFVLALWTSAAFAGESTYLVPKLNKIAIDANDADWTAHCVRVDAMADVRVDHRPDLPSSPVVRIGRDDGGLILFIHAADRTPLTPEIREGDRVEVLLADPRTRAGSDGHGYQLTVTPNRASTATAPTVSWTDKRVDTVRPLRVEAASFGSAEGYSIEMRLPWSNFDGPGQPGSEACLQVYVYDAAAGLDRTTFGLKPSTESRWLGPDQMALIRLADRPSPPVRLAVYAEYQRYRRTQVRITDVAANARTRYVVTDATGRSVGETTAHGRPGDTTRVTLNLPMPQPVPADRTLVVTRVAGDDRPAESASVVPAGPLGREDMLATAEFLFDTTVFSGTTFPASDFADPLAVEDAIGPYTVVRRFFDADLNEVTAADKPGRYGALVTVNGQDGLKGQRQITLYRVPEPFKWWTQSVGGTGLSPPVALGVPTGAVTAQQAAVGRWLADAVRTDARHAGPTAAVLAALNEVGPNAPPFVERTGPYARDEHWWYRLEKRLGVAKHYPFMTVLPAGYASPDAESKRYPLLVFLHGVGQCGNDPNDLADWGPMPVLRDRRDNPFLAVAPRCPYRDWWRVDRLNDLLDEIAAKYRVDPSRIYITGLSMGGGGTWDYAAAFPQRIAAAVPICANGDYDDLTRLKDVPIWAFLGVKDPGVDASKAKVAFATLKSLGADATLTAYEDGGHDIWDRAYRSDSLYTWLLAHQRKSE